MQLGDGFGGEVNPGDQVVVVVVVGHRGVQPQHAGAEQDRLVKRLASVRIAARAV